MVMRASSLRSSSRLATRSAYQRTRMQSSSAPIKSAAEAHYKIIDRATDFEQKQARRPAFNPSTPITLTKSPNPAWTYGSGVKQAVTPPPSVHIEVDPYAPDRPMISNYRLLISGIAPRPIGFLSTISKSGTKNLAPFSYFQVIDHDPPMFVIGFSSRPGRAKDTFLNLQETGECVINTVSEDMIEAVNATSLDAPAGVSEWDISGLTEASTTTVAASRVKESVFAIEGKVVDIKEFRDPEKEGMSVAANVLVKASRFWVRGDATNEDVSHVELSKLRPVGQLGGMAYARVSETFEVPRRRWADEVRKNDVLREIENGTNKIEVEDTSKEVD